MSLTTINGSTQIRAATVPLSALVTGYSVPTANLAQGSLFLLSTGAVAMGAALNLGGFQINNVAAPTATTDAANKAYVDQKAGGIGGIHEVDAYGAANTSISSAPSTLDGVTLTSGMVVLLGAQTTASQNGPWTFASSGAAMTRPTWWASGSTVNIGQYFLVATGGTTYGDTKFWNTNTSNIVVDTTAATFTQDSSGTTYSAGTGLTLTGGAFSVNYGTTSTTAAVGNDSRITGAYQTSSFGTNVATAVGTAVGTAGSIVVNGGVLGTPSSGTLTNCTGLPLGSVTGFGTGVATALANNTGASGGFPVLATGGFLAAAQFPALSGDVTTTAGSLAATVNNTSGSGFTKYTDFVANETPSGSINGSNTTFTLAHTPATVNGSASSLQLYYNGELQDIGSGNDFTLSGSTITMLFTPQTGDKLRAYYMI